MTTGPRSRREARPAIVHLHKDEAFQALSSRLELLQRTQQTLDENWPNLALKVLAVRHESLLIQTPNAALAAKCRQIEPSVIARLKPLYPGLVQVRFRPATASRAAPAQRTSVKQPIGATTLQAMRTKMESMPAGIVRDALARLLARRQS